MWMLFVVSTYIISLISLCFISNLITYCLILIFNCLCCLTIITFISGLSWYSLMLYLVYVGGVYILLLFITVHIPNNLINNRDNGAWLVVSSFIAWEIASLSWYPHLLVPDYSFNFCSAEEGVSYLVLCFLLGVMFFFVSLVSGSKESFVR
uniref:NADH dehydrogenase subunit 6 n=1 Tax=Tetrancistrum nebulosi TaxID=879209 RepID=I3NLS3_9PLAT|nr:NADH dehydrogenase subunit 6 [Tetrancistrum nebulosi]ADN44066.1 NADH dehydrogenase subunit 6 [Tetrancistrum nebulosi]